MTDCNLIRDELMQIMGCDENEVEQYSSHIENTAVYVSSLLKNSDTENDSRVVHLCAVKVFYKIALLKEADDSFTSFKAGDVSYTKDNSYLTRAKELMSLAVQECSGILNSDYFVFEAV
ncbi:MAG: hypothetical protein ACI4IQ_07030 [Eubacterium sp.]